MWARPPSAPRPLRLAGEPSRERGGGEKRRMRAGVGRSLLASPPFPRALPLMTRTMDLSRLLEWTMIGLTLLVGVGVAALVIPQVASRVGTLNLTTALKVLVTLLVLAVAARFVDSLRSRRA